MCRRLERDSGVAVPGRLRRTGFSNLKLRVVMVRVCVCVCVAFETNTS